MYTRYFKARYYELDALGHLNNAVYLNYLQQTAMEASDAAGYTLQRYEEMGRLWVARKTIIEYVHPVVYGDEVAVKTWVSDFKRVQSHREYLVTHRSSNKTIAHARTNWVFVNSQTLAPTRIPSEMITAFKPDDKIAIRHTNPGQGEKPTLNPRRYTSKRQVQPHELDAVQHVNNAIYLNWVQHAFMEAMAMAGYNRRTFFEDIGVIIVARRNEIEYFLPAVMGDEIEIISWVSTMARTHGTWIHEMRRSTDQTLLARAYATGAFLDWASGRPTRLPEAYQITTIGSDN